MRNILLLILLFVSVHLITPYLLQSQINQDQQSRFSGKRATALCQEAKGKRDLYFGMWKKEFLKKRNNMSHSYFDSHVSIITYDNNCSKSGVGFRVEYQVRYDWALIKQNDMFAVLMSSQEDAYRHLPIKRDRFFR